MGCCQNKNQDPFAKEKLVDGSYDQANINSIFFNMQKSDKDLTAENVKSFFKVNPNIANSNTDNGMSI